MKGVRMLRDEGGRLADEDSQVYIGAAPGSKNYDFELDDQTAERIDPPTGPRRLVFRIDRHWIGDHRIANPMPSLPAKVIPIVLRRDKRPNIDNLEPVNGHESLRSF